MVHHYDQLFDDSAWRARARGVADRTHELSSFLVNQLGVEDVGASFSGQVTWHDACHGLRDLGIKDEPRRLLRRVTGAELVELPNAEACCGFGGTFSVKYPEISVAILDEKVDAIERAGVDAVVSGDASCLMQIGGRLSRRGSAGGAPPLAGEVAVSDRPFTGGPGPRWPALRCPAPCGTPPTRLANARGGRDRGGGNRSGRVHHPARG